MKMDFFVFGSLGLVRFSQNLRESESEVTQSYLPFLGPHGLYVAYQSPLSMGFSRQEYWSGLPFPPPGDLPNPGIEPGSLSL